MELYTALIESQRAVQRQFDESTETHRRLHPAPQRPPLSFAIRSRLSAGLHALARAIEPAARRPATGRTI